MKSVLSDIKAHPGNVSLNSLLDVGVQVINAWRARATASSPSHLRRFAPEVRHVLLAALLFQRQREITDTLVELLNSTVHRINARAERKVTEALDARVGAGPSGPAPAAASALALPADAGRPTSSTSSPA